MEHKVKINDKLVITDTLEFKIKVILKHPPIEELKEALASKRYFEGLVLSTSYYEITAIDKIKQFLEKKELNISINNFGRIGLSQILVFLYSHKLINHNDYCHMNELIGYRNKIVHREANKIDEKDAIRLINDGIICLGNLEKVKLL
jgi:hypothetical protein